MKKQGLWKKLAALALAGTMVLGMGITSSAAGVTGDGETNVESIPVTKTITVVDNDETYAPAIEKFSVTVSTESTGTGTINDQAVKVGVLEGLTGGLLSRSDVSEPDTTAKTYQYKGALNVNVSAFEGEDKGVGIYEYKVKETPVTYDGLVQNEEEYYVYVYVASKEETDELYVPYVVATKTRNEVMNNNVKSNLEFTNKYTTNRIAVKKIITGDQSVESDEFTFEVKVKPSNVDEQYKMVVSEGSSSRGTQILNKDMLGEDGYYSVSIELGHEDTVTIHGLSESDEYSIVETDANTNGYRTENATITGSEADGTTKEVTNTRSATTPTGLFLNYAPYLLLVLAAGVLAVVFFRRKRTY